jgi:hypothetical protein
MEVEMQLPFSGGLFMLIALLGWLLPIAVAVWLILSINEIKSLLRDIRDDLRTTR